MKTNVIENKVNKLSYDINLEDIKKSYISSNDSKVQEYENEKKNQKFDELNKKINKIFSN